MTRAYHCHVDVAAGDRERGECTPVAVASMRMNRYRASRYQGDEELAGRAPVTLIHLWGVDTCEAQTCVHSVEIGHYRIAVDNAHPTGDLPGLAETTIWIGQCRQEWRCKLKQTNHQQD